jgi:hypothetical protein
MRYIKEALDVLNKNCGLRVEVYLTSTVAHLFIEGGGAETFVAYIESSMSLRLNMVGDRCLLPVEEPPVAIETMEPRSDAAVVLAGIIAKFHAINVAWKKRMIEPMKPGRGKKVPDRMLSDLVHPVGIVERVKIAQELVANLGGSWKSMDESLFWCEGDEMRTAYVRGDGRVTAITTTNSDEFLKMFM